VTVTLVTVYVLLANTNVTPCESVAIWPLL